MQTDLNANWDTILAWKGHIKKHFHRSFRSCTNQENVSIYISVSIKSFFTHLLGFVVKGYVKGYLSRAFSNIFVIFYWLGTNCSFSGSFKKTVSHIYLILILYWSGTMHIKTFQRLLHIPLETLSGQGQIPASGSSSTALLYILILKWPEAFINIILSMLSQFLYMRKTIT